MTHAEHHAALIAYLKAKVEVHDWHGVSDAANDLRVLEAERACEAPEILCCREILVSASEGLRRCRLILGHTSHCDFST